MKKEPQREILFSNRFQKVFDHLGVFSVTYVRGDNKGIDPDSFIKESGSVIPGAKDSIAFLLEHKVIVKKPDGLLHLNMWKFHGMTIWDLLILVETWLTEETPPGLLSTGETFIELCRSERLTDAYIEYYRSVSQ